jgi:hypothetical protein
LVVAFVGVNNGPKLYARRTLVLFDNRTGLPRICHSFSDVKMLSEPAYGVHWVSEDNNCASALFGLPTSLLVQMTCKYPIHK